MGKFLSSKVFVIVCTLFTLAIGMIAGWLLGYQPSVSGSVSGHVGMGIGSTSGKTATEYIFQIKTACGYWLLAILITFIVFLLCITIRKQYINCTTHAEIDK